MGQNLVRKNFRLYLFRLWSRRRMGGAGQSDQPGVPPAPDRPILRPDEIRANKLKAEAEAKGYIVNVAKEDANGLFRTTVLVENGDVENSLQKIKSEINQRAWIYCIKCNLN